jgi:hypothetical protein
VEWLKVQALSSNSNTAKKNPQKTTTKKPFKFLEDKDHVSLSFVISLVTYF